MVSGTPALGRIGRYELLSRLGAGGMGEVFLARATGAAGFTKPVVIKRILPQLAGDERFVRRFLEEGKLVVQLRHSCIAQVLDMGEVHGIPYMVMEHIDGRDLRELLRLSRGDGDGLPTQVAALLLVHVLEALDYAHGASAEDGQALGIIHRDVSPANVMVSRTGEVKLLDFGIARAVDRQGLSLPGAVQGKFAYMSPEQAAGHELDARSDQFSVGVMAWELLVGRRPFDGDSDMATLERIRTLEAGSLGDAWEGAPFDVVVVIDRLLARAPDERFGRAGEAARALREWLVGDGSLGDASEICRWVDRLLGDEEAGQPVSMDDALSLGLEGRGTDDDRPATATATVLTPSVGGDDWGGLTELPGVTTPPTAGSETRGSRGRRWSLVALLVTLNLLLLGTVGFLAWQQGLSPTVGTEIPRKEAPATTRVDPPVEASPAKPTNTSAAPAEKPVEVEAPEAPVEAAPVPEAVEPAPAAVASGRVRFRFFPASARVLIDGAAVAPLRPGSNVMELKLPARRHTVTLVGRDGSRRKIPFQVRAGQLTNLATLSLDGDDAGRP